MENFYGINNYHGVNVPGLKDSVYKLKENSFPDLLILEEKEFEDNYKNGLVNFFSVLDSNSKVFEKSDEIIKAGKRPIVFAGDHAIGISTVSATSNNYENFGLIWIDAHADINTVHTSPSGNIHGMPVSFLLGEGDLAYSNLGGFRPKVKAENIVYLGLRDVDPGEVEILSKLNIKSYYYKEIEENGIEKVLEEVGHYLENTVDIHISFDFDSIDPKVFEAVSTPVERGFSIEEVYKIFNFMFSKKNIVAFDFVEYNASRDSEGKCYPIVEDFVNYVIEKMD